MKRLGILGAGHHACEQHGAALKLLSERQPGQIELTAVCDLVGAKAARFAERFGVRHVFDNLEAMLAETKLDALIAITPVAATERIVAELLPKGLPLLIEKPPGENSAAAARLLKLSEQTRTPCMLSFNRRFQPGLRRAREWLALPGAGRTTRQAVVRMYRHDRRERDFITATGVHALDAIASLLGPASAVLASSVTSGADGTRSFQAEVLFTRNATASITIAPAAGTTEETYEILGDDFTIALDALRHCLTIAERGRIVLDWRAPEEMPDCERDGTFDETAAFVRALAKGFAGLPGLRDGLRALRLAEALAAGGAAHLLEGNN